MKNIWITGAKGFVGLHLSKSLLKKKYNVYGIGNYKNSNYKDIVPSFKNFVSGNINSINLQKLYNHSGCPDIIFHLAGGSSVGQSIINPLLDFKKTVLSTSNLLEFLRIKNINSKIIFSSSAAVYGNIHNKPINESDKCKPLSPYGYNKFIAEKLFESYVKNFNIDSCIIRFFSIYGIEAKKQLIWDICTKLNRNQKAIELFGTGEEMRDWIYIKDAVKLLIMASDSFKKKSGEISIFNGNSGYHHSVKEILYQICELMELSPSINFNKNTRSGDPNYLIGSNYKTKNILGFKPDFDIKNGLNEYITWFKFNNL